MTRTRMFQEYPVSLVKLSLFYIKGKIIQVLDFDNWHPLNQRNSLLRDLSFIPIVTLDTLLYGCSTYDEQRNSQIINAVLLFIKDSNRVD